MKRSVVFILVTILSLSLTTPVFSAHIQDVVAQLAQQDGRFKTVVRDLKEVDSGEGGMSRNEMLMDIGQNFAHIAKSSPADKKLLEEAIDFFAQYSEKNQAFTRSRTAKMPVLRGHQPRGFFKDAWDKAKELPQIIYEEIMDFDIDADVDIVNVNLLEGVSMSAKYKYKVDSDYGKGIHTRIDQWTPKTNISLMSLVNSVTGAALPIYVNISAGREIIFVRHYKEKWAAMKALPKTPLNMPFRVKEVQKMEVGDFCSIPAKMGFNAGLSLGWTQGIFSAGASGGVLMTGEFRINIYKTDKNHVRLKISGLRKHGVSGGVHINYGLNFFGHDPLIGEIDIDDQVESLLGTNLFKINRSRIKGQQLTVDYVFDLRDEEACMAFEAIVFKTLKFKATQVGKEFLVENNLDEIVFGDLEPAEMLFQADKGLDPEDRRVDRCFMGSNYALTNANSFKIGIKLANYKTSTSDTRNRVRVIDQNDRATNYLYPIYRRNTESSFLFGIWKEKVTRVNYSFYLSNTEWQPVELYDVVFTLNHFDKRCRESELKDYLEYINGYFDEEMAQNLGFAGYNDIKFTRNFKSQIQFAIKKEGIYALHQAKVSKDALYAAFLPIIKDFEYYSHHHNDDDHGFDNGYVHIFSKWTPAKKAAAKLCNDKWGGKYYWHMIDRVVRTFDKHRDAPLHEYVKMIKDLFAKSDSFFHDDFYEEVIPRYVYELVKLTSSRENAYATISFGGAEIKPHRGKYGQTDYWGIYHNINEILYQIRYNHYGLPRTY